MKRPQHSDMPYPEANAVRVARLEEQVHAIHEVIAERDKALVLQSSEWVRRMEVAELLAQEAVRNRSHFVTVEKWEDRVKTDTTARETALARLNEILNDFVRRYELDKRNEELRAQAQEQALTAIQRASERQAMEAKEAASKAEQGARLKAEEMERAAQEAARKVERRTNFRLAIVGLVLTCVIALANYVGSF